MSNKNIFNSAADRARTERTVNFFNNASRAACISGLGCFGAVLFGAANPILVAGAALGIGASIAINERVRKKEALLNAAKNDIYTPQ